MICLPFSCQISEHCPFKSIFPNCLTSSPSTSSTWTCSVSARVCTQQQQQQQQHDQLHKLHKLPLFDCHRDSVTRKVDQLRPWGLDPTYWPHVGFTFSWSVIQLIQFFNCLSYWCKISLTFSGTAAARRLVLYAIVAVISLLVCGLPQK